MGVLIGLEREAYDAEEAALRVIQVLGGGSAIFATSRFCMLNKFIYSLKV
jgi:hypothetical protein